MTGARFSDRQSQLARASARLSEARDLPASDISRDALIQRFQFTFELCWKTLQAYLQHLGHDVRNPRGALRRAAAEGLLASSSDADLWMAMLEDRNLLSHTYDEEFAESAAGRIRDLYVTAILDLTRTIGQLDSR